VCHCIKKKRESYKHQHTSNKVLMPAIMSIDLSKNTRNGHRISEQSKVRFRFYLLLELHVLYNCQIFFEHQIQ
jgi:hypothetical protein